MSDPNEEQQQAQPADSNADSAREQFIASLNEPLEQPRGEDLTNPIMPNMQCLANRRSNEAGEEEDSGE
jgi:hypothetical protein